MTKVNKQIRSEIAGQMKYKHRERNEQIDQINKLPISEELKEQSRKAIMENFEKQVDEMKKMPGYQEAKRTYVEEKEAKNRVAEAKKTKEALIKEYEEKLAKADEDILESEKLYEEAQIAHRGEVEEESDLESEKIPEDLKNYREVWKNRILGVKRENMEKIIKTVDNIPVKIDEDEDGSRLIVFKLGDKTYKILDPRLENHTDDEYRDHWSFESITKVDKDVVRYNGMRGGSVDNWGNQKLKEYVKEKQGEGLHIPEMAEMQDLLGELGKQAGLDSGRDQIAMLMYLSGMQGMYWLGSGFGDARGFVNCSGDGRELNTLRSDDYNASLCMIASN